MVLSTKPPKWTSDWFPEEFAVRKYIFDTWRSVCLQFGYDEYLWPLVEDIAIWQAKSGEDVGGTELTRITNRVGEISDLALRPEMTPTVTRMVAREYNKRPKPIRWFSIANFYRNERPQRGRNREFWQLNVDLFGGKEASVREDVELLQLAICLMKAFDVPADSWDLSLNDRRIIDHILDDVAELGGDIKQETVRTMDKWDKLPADVFTQTLTERGLTDDQIGVVVSFMQCGTLDNLLALFPSVSDNDGYIWLMQIMDLLTATGYADDVKYKASLIRWFDYYDGMVFEVFDKHPDNNRALFGGGRYNGLADIFGVKWGIPAVGMGIGDETMKLFLESWGLLEKRDAWSVKYFVPLLSDSTEHYVAVMKTVAWLRAKGHAVVVDTHVKKMGKIMKYADATGYTYVILHFDDETKIKNMITWEETLF